MTVSLYRNTVHHPDYKRTLPSAVKTFSNVTPVSMDAKSGQISVSAVFSDLADTNYLKIEEGGVILYAWITNIRSMGRTHSWVIDYSVDALRTYFDHIVWDNQMVLRDPTPTLLYDPLLSATQPYPEHYGFTGSIDIANSYKRLFVVAVRAPSGGGTPSIVPVMPTIFQYYITDYDARDWDGSYASTFVQTMTADPPDPRIVTAYSVPYFDISSLSAAGATAPTGLSNFKVVGITNSITPAMLQKTTSLIMPSVIDDFFRVKHESKIIIPGAGIINVDDDCVRNGFKIRRDMDFFSGATNFMLLRSDDSYTGASVRMGAISSIPIIGDPKDMYLSQNQNALSTAMIGDVATIAGGIGLAMMTGGASAPVSAMLLGEGATQVTRGVSSMVNRNATIQDQGRVQTSPPAMLATALAANFNDSFIFDAIWQKVDNAAIVHAEAGYPQNIFKALTLPNTGFIQTEGCSVKTDGKVPQWAVDDINRRLDMGMEIEA